MTDAREEYWLEYPKRMIVKGQIIGQVISTIKDRYKVIETTDHETGEDILLISKRKEDRQVEPGQTKQ